MAAMETLLNMLPLDICIKGVARMGAYRLKCNNSWRNLEYGHSRITSIITNPVLEMDSDYASKIFLCKTIQRPDGLGGLKSKGRAMYIKRPCLTKN
jgi:hypothetical protein